MCNFIMGDAGGGCTVERAKATLSEIWGVGQELGGAWFDGRGITALRQSRSFRINLTHPESRHSFAFRYRRLGPNHFARGTCGWLSLFCMGLKRRIYGAA